VPVDDIEIFSLQSAIKAQRSLEPRSFVETGERVRVTRGALSGIEGIVLEVRKSLRFVLSITLLQRSVQLEVDPSWIVPCDS
jgi:transcription antitermination factor NusG